MVVDKNQPDYRYYYVAEQIHTRIGRSGIMIKKTCETGVKIISETAKKVYGWQQCQNPQWWYMEKNAGMMA